MNKDDKIIMSFAVLWQGWECDSEAWIMQRPNGERYIKMTSHGSSYEASLEELEERIAAYEDAIQQTTAAIALVTNHDRLQSKKQK